MNPRMARFGNSSGAIGGAPARTLSNNVGAAPWRSAPRIGDVVREAVRRIVRQLLAVEAAHVARGAGRYPHVAGRQRLRRSVEAQEVFLCAKHDAVLRLLVNLDLGMIGSEMALPACRRQPGDRDRTRMARVTRRTGADRTVVVRLADAVTVGAAARHRRWSLQRDERMRGPPRVSRLETFSEVDLLGLQSLVTKHRRPRHSRVTTVEELLIDRFVTAAAVAGRQLRRDREPVVFQRICRTHARSPPMAAAFRPAAARG